MAACIDPNQTDITRFAVTGFMTPTDMEATKAAFTEHAPDATFQIIGDQMTATMPTGLPRADTDDKSAPMTETCMAMLVAVAKTLPLHSLLMLREVSHGGSAVDCMVFTGVTIEGGMSGGTILMHETVEEAVQLAVQSAAQLSKTDVSEIYEDVVKNSSLPDERAAEAGLVRTDADDEPQLDTSVVESEGGFVAQGSEAMQ